MIWEWAWKEYKRAGSLRDLLEGTRARKYSRRVSEELQDELYTALETILNRAPSAVIEDVARSLAARAGRDGDEKSIARYWRTNKFHRTSAVPASTGPKKTT